MQKRVLLLEHDKGTPLSVLAEKFNMAAVAEAVLAVQPATAEAALKDWIVFDDADEVIIDMLTGEDVDDVVDDLLAEEGDDDQSDDEAAAVAGPMDAETFATLNEKACAALACWTLPLRFCS